MRKQHRGMRLIIDNVNLSRDHRKEWGKQIFLPIGRTFLGMDNLLKSIRF